MSIPTLNRRQSREIDRRAMEEYSVPGLILMENAGRGVAEKLLELKLPDPVLICCGKGNNAGDGFVIARHLELHGLRVELLVWAEASQLRGDAQINFEIIQCSGLPMTVLGHEPRLDLLHTQLARAGCVVDALLGTGAIGEPRPPFDAVIDALNASGRPVLAVDLPSGFDCDTGLPATHTIRASHTCTFVCHKPGFLAPGAGQYTGQVHVVSIGAPRKLLEEMLAGQHHVADRP